MTGPRGPAHLAGRASSWGCPELQPSAEERVRANLEERQRFFERVWKSGPVGKTFVVLVLLAFAAPFMFELFALYAVWAWLWPATVTITEKLATLGFLFVVLNVIALQVSRWAALLWEYAYVMRPSKWRKKKTTK